MNNFKTYIKYNWKIFTNHKIDFRLNLISIIFNQIVSFLFLYVIISKLPNLMGWKTNSIILIYGLFELNKGSADFFSAGIKNLEDYIQTGKLDTMLTRPVSLTTQIITSKFDFFQLVNIFTGICCIAIYFINNNFNFKLINIGIIFFYQILAIIEICSLKFSVTSIAFWTQTSTPILASIDNLSTFAQYPLDIYGNTLRNILTFIFPYAFLSFFPATSILNISNIGKNIIFSILLLIVTLVITRIVWVKGLKGYESSGH